MKNYKTFGFYLKQMIQILIFFGLLFWLLSCSGSRKDEVIRQIHAYRDSIGINKGQQRLVIMQTDSMKRAYNTSFPPGIAHMLMRKIRLEADEIGFRDKIDSLKIELER